MSRRARNWQEKPIRRVTLRLLQSRWDWLESKSYSWDGGLAAAIERAVEVAFLVDTREDLEHARAAVSLSGMLERTARQ